MRVYALTKLGRKVASTKDESSDEMKILQFIMSQPRDGRTATLNELEAIVDNPRIVCRRLKGRGLIQELTT